MKMKALFLGLLLVLGIAGASLAGEKAVIMKLAGTTPANPDLGEYAAMVKFAELVKEYSNGSITCEVYPANQLGTTTEFIEGTSLGTIEACVAGTDTIAFLDPAMNVFSMPFLFKSNEHQMALLNTDNEVKAKLFASLSRRGNLKHVGTLFRGFRVMANSKRPVRSPADLKGMSIRSPESIANVKTIEALGGLPVTITWSEVFTSLSQKVCDGVENAITELYSINLQEVVKYVSETNHLPGIVLVVVNEPWFNGLSPAQQAAVAKAGADATTFRSRILVEEQKKAYAGFAAKGAEILYAKDLDNDAFRAACADVYKQFLDKFDEATYIAIRDMKF